MATLLLQCVAPLQAWGTYSQFSVRDTGREPSKSGIIGLLCAALGRQRDDTDTIAQLAALEMAVRVDCEGRILRDYHTAGLDGYFNASGKVTRSSLITSDRYYLMDAAFLVALSGETMFLRELHEALRDPHWMLSLGRKSCPPSRPVYIPARCWDWGKSADNLFETYPWLGRSPRLYADIGRVRVVHDDPNGSETRHDVPLNFAYAARQFAYRNVTTRFIDKPRRALAKEDVACFIFPN